MSRTDVLDELALRIASVVRDHPVRVGIDGVDGAGKTTLADALVAPLHRLGRTEFAVSAGPQHLRVSVAAFNTRSLRVWAALGFVEEHRFEHAQSGRTFVQLVAPMRAG